MSDVPMFIGAQATGQHQVVVSGSSPSATNSQSGGAGPAGSSSLSQLKGHDPGAQPTVSGSSYPLQPATKLGSPVADVDPVEFADDDDALELEVAEVADAVDEALDEVLDASAVV